LKILSNLNVVLPFCIVYHNALCTCLSPTCFGMYSGIVHGTLILFQVWECKTALSLSFFNCSYRT